MRRLREHAERLLERAPRGLQIRLRLRVLCVALRVELVSARAHEGRSEHTGDGGEHRRREVPHCRRGEAQLARWGLCGMDVTSAGGLAGVGSGLTVRKCRPRRGLVARDVLWVCGSDVAV